MVILVKGNFSGLKKKILFFVFYSPYFSYTYLSTCILCIFTIFTYSSLLPLPFLMSPPFYWVIFLLPSDLLGLLKEYGWNVIDRNMDDFLGATVQTKMSLPSLATISCLYVLMSPNPFWENVLWCQCWAASEFINVLTLPYVGDIIPQHSPPSSFHNVPWTLEGLGWFRCHI